MTDDALVLIGRTDARDVIETHASRLSSRGVADGVHVALCGREPGRELRSALAGVTANTVYAVPMTVAHNRDTLGPVPAALAGLPGEVRYCEPIGCTRAVTTVLAERAAAAVPPGPDVSLALVAFGDSSLPYQRRVTETHARRLRESGYGEVTTCYLLQNPAVECVRYNVTGEHAVAVPLFLADCEETERAIPRLLELDRGGFAYADVLGTHEALTDAVESRVATRRAIGREFGHGPDGAPQSFEDALTVSARRLAADGRGSSDGPGLSDGRSGARNRGSRIQRPNRDSGPE